MKNKPQSNPQQDYKKTRNYLRGIGYPRKAGRAIIKGYMGEAFISYELAGVAIQKNWSAFMAYYGRVKSKYADQRVNGTRFEDYDEWYQRNSMDGGFAYNNSADDF